MIHISDWLPTFAKIAGVNVDRPIDGKNVWSALSYDLASPRREALVHYDQMVPHMAYISDNYKLVSGTTYNGTFDRWFHEAADSSQQNVTYGDHYSEAILSSPAGEILSKYSKTHKTQLQNDVPSETETISKEEIDEIRSMAQITCNGHTPPANDSNKACNPLESPCLFDISHDPCETTNLATQFPDIVKKLEAKLDHYGSIALPVRNRPADPRCNPANFGGIWTWWYDELNITASHSSGMKKKNQRKN